jgi:hypothetical protein
VHQVDENSTAQRSVIVNEGGDDVEMMKLEQ